MHNNRFEITANISTLNFLKQKYIPSPIEAFLRSNVSNLGIDNGYIKIPAKFKRIKIDIGLSHKAPHIREWLSQEKDLLVFGFEPRKDCIDLLNKDNIEGAIAVPCALFNVKEPTEMSFNVTKNPHNEDGGASSLFNPKNEWKDKLIIKERITVPVFNLKMFLDMIPWGTNDIEYIEYIKIDAQGADLNILMSIEEYLKNRVVYVTAEPDGHCYEGADINNHNDIISYMKKIGFEYVFHPNTKDPTFINRKYWHLKDNVYIKQKDY
jgi:FkbM family methyltransferase